jgi:hypothetical protein
MDATPRKFPAMFSSTATYSCLVVCGKSISCRPLCIASSRGCSSESARLYWIQEVIYFLFRDVETSHLRYQRTPFGYMCDPRYIDEDGSLCLINVPSAQHKQIIREYQSWGGIWCLNGNTPVNDGIVQEFQLLVQISGGLCFVHDGYNWGRKSSPIFLASRYSRSFSIFRTALVCELVHTHIKVHPDGWTVEGLFSLYLEQSKFKKERTFTVQDARGAEDTLKIRTTRNSNGSGKWRELELVWTSMRLKRTRGSRAEGRCHRGL